MTSPAVVVGDTAYITTRSGVEAVALADGSLRWSAPIGPPVNQGHPPVVRGGTVYAINQSSVVALRRSDGHVRASAELLTPVGLTATRDAIDVTGGSGDLARFDPRTLTLRYHEVLNPPGGLADPTVVGDTIVVVVSDFGGPVLEGLDAATGALRWSNPQPFLATQTVAVAHGLVFVPTFTGFGEPTGIAAFGLSDGRLVWGPGALSNDFTDTPAVAKGIVYAPAFDQLVALDEVTGAVLWRGPAVVGTPVIAGGLLWGRDMAGGIEAYDPRHGTLVAQISALVVPMHMGPFQLTPVGDRVLIAGTDADGTWELVAFALPGG